MHFVIRSKFNLNENILCKKPETRSRENHYWVSTYGALFIENI